MKDAKGHGSEPRNGYFAKPLSSGKIAVFRKGTGTMVTKFTNMASAEHHIGRQNAEDHENRVGKVNDYLAERKARPPQVPEVSSQLNLFGSGEAHVSAIASAHGVSTSHLK